MYANKDEKGQSESDDELRFVSIKEYDLDREIREERALISLIENKLDWIIDSGVHITWLVIWISLLR